ncbi:Protein N-acetyltransferase, RimJ/RimL family [Kosakonia oryzendophytica]|uniref:Protein N-acetyltransferase, RimJ/RimL family n=1 Tax=Kosakonia oryzendophytica TaxID=1005665 RepID=A0A1C4AG09_9ENTR|nr:GNAT family protein [Kosakonia oryzendophytica]SCB93574.1 Protein N-acetyltransferase, RimJ/RimL family [Kosakonia oryzendophytica]
MPELNHYGQHVGNLLTHWSGVQPLPHSVLQGRYCRLEPLDVRVHTPHLLHAYSQAEDDSDWTWLASGRPDDVDSMARWVIGKMIDKSVHPFAVVDAATNRAVGVIAWLANNTQHGTVEIGHVTWSPLMKKSVLGTEAVWLMLRHAFVCDYRRVEWKCDTLNVASRRAAERLGFTWEGCFRQHMVRKGRNRDTDYLSMLDSEWPQRDAAISAWLSASNFDSQGQQKQTLATFFANVSP